MGERQSGQPQDPRWVARPRAAAAVRAAVFGVPVAASTGAGWTTAALLPAPGSTLGAIGTWAAVLAVSVVVLVAAERVLRRLAPLAVLLSLALTFPDRAPSRLRVAREAVRHRSVEEHLARLAQAGQDPARAAEVVLTLVAALDRHDRATRGHAERVRLFTDLIAEELGLPEHDRDRLRWASLLHDVGKLAVPATLLNKPGKPDETEWATLRRHPDIGAELARPLMPWLGEWGDLIAQHHERWDGTGYPRGLAARDICRGGRIVAVADAFDVMTASRAYRRPVSRAAAYRELVRCAGSQFDPDVVRALVGISVPRLRRAQGALALLSDVPLLAARTVPATTLVQAVGAGALVVGGTGVAGMPAWPAPVVAPTAATTTSTPAPAVTGQPAGAGGTTAPSLVAGEAPAGRSSAGAPDTDVEVVPATSSGSSSSGPRGGSNSGPGGGSSSSGSGGTSGSGSGDTLGGVTGTVGDTVGGVAGTVGDTVGGVGDAVGDTVGGPVGDVVGGVTGTVGETVSDVGGTVDDTVSDVGGTVDDTVDDVGGLLGGLLGGGR